MKKSLLTIQDNTLLAGDIGLLVLDGADIVACGEFVEVKLSDFTLRRPFGVADYCDGKLTIIYRIVGRGTEAIKKLKKGDTLDVITGLGRGFSIEKAKDPLLVGGGMGIAPLYYLAKAFRERGIIPRIILGFRSASEVFFVDEFKALGEVYVTTDDGSVGIKGNVITQMKLLNYDFYYACGPMPMLKGLSKFDKNGEISLEARMGCGFGACMGCSIKTTNGYKRVCKEGPVFPCEEVIFDD